MSETASNSRSSRVLISQRALQKNWTSLQNLLTPGTKILPIVKANAYGHGLLAISNLTQDLGAVGAGVADLCEAYELRHKGYKSLILSMGSISKDALDYASSNNIILTARSEEDLHVLKTYSFHPDQKIKLHIKLDTGMNRWGFSQTQWGTICETLKPLPNVSLEGIYTHFCEANNPDKSFTQAQLELFKLGIEHIEHFFGKRLIRHAANTGGILHHPESHFDWVRSGVGIYGYPTLNDKAAPFEPVLEWRATLLQIKKVAAGETIGYNRAYRVTKPMIVGTIGVGYGDGYQRSYQSVSILYKGTRLSILGIICMDALMVDLTPIQNPKVFDEVTLIGQAPGAITPLAITALDIANQTQTIPYEILTRIQSRVPRIIVRDHAVA